jgi:maleate isomerase
LKTRIGFLIPPGNPTTEPEMIALTPPGVSIHFTRMVAGGATGSLEGQEERNRSQIVHLDECISLLALVKPNVIVLAHTATSYTLGREGERELMDRLTRQYGMPCITAFGSVVRACEHLGVRRLALGTPYSEDMTLRGKAHLEAHGLEVVHYGRLQGVTNIYDETPERAYQLARAVDHPRAQAVFLSGVGMPTVDVLETLEKDLRKPVFSSAAAMMWNALRIAGVRHAIAGFGSLLANVED